MTSEIDQYMVYLAEAPPKLVVLALGFEASISMTAGLAGVECAVFSVSKEIQISQARGGNAGDTTPKQTMVRRTIGP